MATSAVYFSICSLLYGWACVIRSLSLTRETFLKGKLIEMETSQNKIQLRIGHLRTSPCMSYDPEHRMMINHQSNP